ncbi:actin-related protein 10 [Lingula anatina]|uniref:Actin-related protein 10 n=1 Tax=Lingula anatina TaxID=7574 RepID=A0A1S3J2W1_LINAN|nr:actin-related protein 10 [Lingula anatina]|eukprot:XP_013404616.1 actin-related protein 10 [Lingula anatina]
MPLYEGISYAGDKNAVIIDIGTAYTKCGFSGETAPRCIVPSEIKRSRSGQVVKVHQYNTEEELYEILVDFIHMLYFRHVLVNPKDRRVVVCESLLTPTVFRDTLAKVLFEHYEVPSILYAPTHLVSLFTLGISSGLVMDAGFTETFVLPIYEGIPILKAWEAIPLGGKAIHRNLESKLMGSAVVKTQDAEERQLCSVVGSLSENILEDIKVRCCFVTKMERAKQIQKFMLQESGLTGESRVEAPKPPPDVEYPLDGDKILHIEGKIRENTCEVLFEQDNEEKSVATLILDSIIKCTIDMRKTLAENIVIMGGTAMLPGFLHRLQSELYDLLSKNKYKQQLAIKNFKFHQLPCKENYAAWLGGAMFGALEVLQNRSLSREQFQETGVIPDWSSLGFEEESEREEKPAVKR